MRRRRLIYRAAHRGTRELDLLLGPFAATELEAMDGAALDGFEAFLEEPDTELQAWFLGEAAPPEERRELVGRILDFKRMTLK